MNKRMNRIFFIFMVTSSVIICADEAKIDQTQQAQESLPVAEMPPQFRLGPHSFNTAYSLYVTAGSPGAKDHTIFSLDGTHTQPLVKEKVRVDYKSDQVNPFYDKKINQIYSIYSKPLVITDENPQNIYYVTNFDMPENPMNVLTSTDIRDANGHVSDGIVKLTFCQTVTDERSHTYIIGAVKSHEGNFGDEGSGFAVLKFESKALESEELQEKEKNSDEEKDNESDTEQEAPQQKIGTFIAPLNPVTGIVGENRAFPLDINKSEKELVQINGGLDYIQPNAVDLFWDENFNRFYVALQIKTKDDAGPDQGACALLVGKVWKDKLYLDPVVLPQVFSPDACNIIGAVGPGRFVSLHKVTVMHSTSGIPYLIVVGGNGKPEETNNLVHAFPLANRSQKNRTVHDCMMDKGHGSIAKNDDMPEYQFYPGRFGRLKSRMLEQVVEDEQDFYNDEQVSVKVGGDTVLPNAIKQIFSVRDVVIALVDQPGNGQEPGVFYSQAIFDQNGKIAAWSCWKRVPGSSPTTIGMNLDPHSFNFTFFDASDQLKIRASSWQYSDIPQQDESTEVQPLNILLQKELSYEQSGIQGLFDFDFTTPGLGQNNKSSLLIATGYKKIVLVQTACEDDAGILCANRTFKISKECKNGATKEIDENCQAVTISGGVLEQLGPITAAEIVTDGIQTWLIVGGVGGLAVLADKNGSGWSANKGIGKDFCNFSSDFSFYKIADYSFVKKLIGHHGLLYVLTQENLDCIPINWQSLEEIKALHPKTLVCQQDLGGYFFDALVSEQCIILATGNGLFFGGEDVSRYAGKVTWKKGELPGASQAILKLFAVTPTGKSSDFVKTSQVFVLSGSVAQSEAEIYRLFVHDGQITLVQDFAYKGHPSRFISFGAFRDNFATDGLTHISLRNSGWPLAHVLPAFIGGKLIASSKGYLVPIGGEHVSSIRQIVKNSATGSWIIGGDFGVCINE